MKRTRPKGVNRDQAYERGRHRRRTWHRSGTGRCQRGPSDEVEGAKAFGPSINPTRRVQISKTSRHRCPTQLHPTSIPLSGVALRLFASIVQPLMLLVHIHVVDTQTHIPSTYKKGIKPPTSAFYLTYALPQKLCTDLHTVHHTTNTEILPRAPPSPSSSPSLARSFRRSRAGPPSLFLSSPTSHAYQPNPIHHPFLISKSPFPLLSPPHIPAIHRQPVLLLVIYKTETALVCPS